MTSSNLKVIPFIKYQRKQEESVSSSITLRIVKRTEVDAEGLKLVWKQLHFDVTVVIDLTRDDMILKMEQVAEECCDEDEAFVCYILIHGTHDGILFGNDNRTSQDSIDSQVNSN